MNRHQRRARAKGRDEQREARLPANGAAPAPVPAGAPALPPPGLTLRVAARIILSDWVLRRIRHPQVLRLVRDVAVQAGRDDVVAALTRRLAGPV